MASVDGTIALAGIRNVEDVLSSAFAIRRFQVVLLTCFAGVGLLLAAVGLYGVVSASVAQREKEIGIRFALGASTRGIAQLIVSEALKPVLVGMAIGIVAAVAAARGIQSLLFGVAPLDLAAYAGGLGALLVSAIAACSRPIRSATRVDPMVSLRHE